VTASGARAILRDAPGVMVMDARDDGGYITPLDCAGEDAVFVSRVRRDPTVEHGLSFWCVPDVLVRAGPARGRCASLRADCRSRSGARPAQAGGLRPLLAPAHKTSSGAG